MAILSVNPALAREQGNSWASSVSGNWQDPEWSLGILPASNQLVFITNAGWKAVAIGPATAQNYPQTMSVAGLTIASPPETFNLMLLNYAGGNAPFTTGSLVVGSNAGFTALHSSLNVTSTETNQFEIDGAFTASVESSVQANYLVSGVEGAATLCLTNSQFSVATQYFSGAYSSVIFQQGGTNSFGKLNLGKAIYNLYDGQCAGSIGMVGATFNQYDGAVTGSISISTGAYEQDGGTNTVDQLIVVGSDPYFAPYYSVGLYSLSNGVLNTMSTVVGYSGSFEQSGGVHAIQGALTVRGIDTYDGPIHAGYTLGGGWLTCKSLDVSDYATFSQSGGTNEIAGDLYISSAVINDGGYQLTAGLLTSSNTTIAWGGWLRQTGGVQRTAGILNLTQGGDFDFSEFDLSGGEFSVSNVVMSTYNAFYNQGGTISGLALLTMAGGAWYQGTPSVQIGALQLSTNSGDEAISYLVMPSSGPCVALIGNSSGLTWSNQATLAIESWNGSLSGGGTDQVIFGSDASGLTSQQLHAIWFGNPSGLPAGTYPAAILSTGEVVPGRALSFTVENGALVLQWGGSAPTLQTSTNLAEPFVDVPGASSPYTNNLTDIQRYFRLRE